MSNDLAGVLFRHRERLKEIGNVLSRYGFARLADHAAEASDPGIAGVLLTRVADPELAAMSAGQRLRGALSELGTTWIKLGQMLSLRPDLVGPDVAAELAQLQADVPADPPGSAEQTIGRTWPSLTSVTSAALPGRARPSSRPCCSPSAPGMS